MRKSIGAIILITFVVLCITGVYYYLCAVREIKIYKEYRVYSPQKTDGVWWLVIPSDELRKKYIKDFDIKIPEVDFKKFYILWSEGRRIKKITYRIISKYKWRYGVPKGIATFGERYYPNSQFFYKINKVWLKQDWLRAEELKKKYKKD